MGLFARVAAAVESNGDGVSRPFWMKASDRVALQWILRFGFFSPPRMPQWRLRGHAHYLFRFLLQAGQSARFGIFTVWKRPLSPS